jgi:hypothetical protein
VAGRQRFEQYRAGDPEAQLGLLQGQHDLAPDGVRPSSRALASSASITGSRAGQPSSDSNAAHDRARLGQGHVSDGAQHRPLRQPSGPQFTVGSHRQVLPSSIPHMKVTTSRAERIDCSRSAQYPRTASPAWPLGSPWGRPLGQGQPAIQVVVWARGRGRGRGLGRSGLGARPPPPGPARHR